jgi:CRP-like cAMP-binding protein
MFVESEQGSAFVARLSSITALAPADITSIKRVLATAQVKDVANGEQISFGGQGAGARTILDKGFAYRCRVRQGSARQILSFVVPGEFLNPFGRRDRFSVVAAVACRTLGLDAEELKALLRRRAVVRALWNFRLQELGNREEQFLSVAHGTAEARIAHVLCDFSERFRMGAVRMAAVPLKQEQLADATGVSAIHANGVLKRFERLRLVVAQRRRIVVLDAAQLANIGDWDGAYLRETSDAP